MLIGITAGFLLAGLLYLLWALVPALQQVRRTAAAVEDLVRKIDQQVDPTLHEARGLVRDVSTLSRRVDGDLKVVSRIVEDIGDTTGYARDMAARIKAEVEQPAMGILSAIMGLRRGVDAFRAHREKKAAPRSPFRRAK